MIDPKDFARAGRLIKKYIGVPDIRSLGISIVQVVLENAPLRF